VGSTAAAGATGTANIIGNFSAMVHFTAETEYDSNGKQTRRENDVGTREFKEHSAKPLLEMIFGFESTPLPIRSLT
jgi:hypothetical protein